MTTSVVRGRHSASVFAMKNKTSSAEDAALLAYTKWQAERLHKARLERMQAQGDRYSNPTRRLHDKDVFAAGYFAALESIK